ncbi:hypothetical protein AGOR_G00175060 [Albula goreensis]|uniref:Ropporin-1-like protein n=1 Tax=Albula goreensis TaxID=1534307 RepID=A0A8T3CZA7_9TELE|nr:hypothetical protein AGOR_G00175060 [Albula goreensis]
MPLPDTMFCVQQINIPPELPDILKQFTKAAIRTQPHDVLQWSAAYFSALSKGETLPVKERLEMPVATQKTDTGLTPGLLKTLHKQLAPKETVAKEQLLENALGGTILSAMKQACEILTQDPEGGAARIPYDTFVSLYTYLADLDGEIPLHEIDSFLASLQEDVERQGGMVQPSNFAGPRHAEVFQ